MLAFTRGKKKVGGPPPGFAQRQFAVLASGVAFSVIAILAGLAAARLLYDRQVDAATLELQNLAAMVAHEAGVSLGGADASVASLARRLRAAGPGSVEALDRLADNAATQSEIAATLAGNARLANLFVIDAEGRVDKAGRQSVLPAELIRSTGYLESLKQAGPGALVVSSPFFADTAESWMIGLSRPVFSPDGAFLGAAGAVLRLSDLNALIARIDLGLKGSVSLFARDGALLAWAPKTQAPFGSNISGSDLHLRFVASAAEGVGDAVGRTDGVARRYAVRNAAPYGLSVVAAKGMPDILSAWFDEARLLTEVGAVSLLMVAFATWRIARRSDRRASERQQELLDREMARQARTLAFAIDNVTQGIAMFDKDSRLSVWNARYAEMFGFTANFLKPGLLRSQLLEFREARGLSRLAGRPTTQPDGSVLTHNKLSDGRVLAQRKKGLPGGGWVSSHEDVTEQIAAQERIQEMATRDALTGLLNRFSFREQLESALEASRRDGSRFAVFYIDLDGFKTVNDTLGHHAGDNLLKQVSERLRRAVRKSDAVARLGGDEFAVIQRAQVLPRDAERLAERIVTSLCAPYDLAGGPVEAGASLGISIAPADSTDPEQIVRNADLALYRSKQQGGGRYSFFNPDMDAEVRERHALEEDLKGAIGRDEFELYYQPVVAFSDGAVRSFEALIRWRHPSRGFVSPGAFIPLAEETGLIVAIGEWVLREACRHAARLPAPLRIAVNVSPAQFRAAGFLDTVKRAVADAGIAPERMIVEITESVMVKDVAEAGATLDALRQMGIVSAMDDFGTGYSSLLYLHKLHFDKVKIDRSFVSSLGEDPSAEAIVRAVVALARALGMETVAEGVETQAQYDKLALIGCTEAQGYLLSRPMPADETLNYLRRGEAAVVAVEPKTGVPLPLVNARDGARTPVLQFARAGAGRRE